MSNQKVNQDYIVGMLTDILRGYLESEGDPLIENGARVERFCLDVVELILRDGTVYQFKVTKCRQKRWTR